MKKPPKQQSNRRILIPVEIQRRRVLQFGYFSLGWLLHKAVLYGVRNSKKLAPFFNLEKIILLFLQNMWKNFDIYHFSYTEIQYSYPRSFENSLPASFAWDTYFPALWTRRNSLCFKIPEKYEEFILSKNIFKFKISKIK